MRPSNPPSGTPIESGAINVGLLGEIGGCDPGSIRPTGDSGTNIDPGAGVMGCSGAGDSAGVSQGSSNEGSIAFV